MNSPFIPQAVRKYSNVIMKGGKGSWIYGHDNKKYLDFTSGIGCFSLGHSNKEINKAVNRQMKRYILAQQMCVHNRPIHKLGESIASITPKSLDVSYMCNSGTDAVDNAIRIARYATGKKIILSFPNAFHGRNLGVSALTDSLVERSKITPFVGSCYTSESVLSQLDNCGDNIAAVIIEPIQGEGGINAFDIDFMKKLRHKCTEKNVLLIADEIQCGMARTGHMFAFSRSEIIPDMILIGKGIGNGYPLACITSTKNIFDKCPLGSLGNTYGGSTLPVVASIKVIEMLKRQNITNKVLEDEVIIKEWAKNEKNILKANVYGLMIGLTFDRNTESLRKTCEQNGLLTLPTRNPNMIRLLPPLNISRKDLTLGLELLNKSIHDNNKKFWNI